MSAITDKSRLVERLFKEDFRYIIAGYILTAVLNAWISTSIPESFESLRDAQTYGIWAILAFLASLWVVISAYKFQSEVADLSDSDTSLWYFVAGSFGGVICFYLSSYGIRNKKYGTARKVFVSVIGVLGILSIIKSTVDISNMSFLLWG